jgi:hypothetical protein
MDCRGMPDIDSADSEERNPSVPRFRSADRLSSFVHSVKATVPRQALEL